MLCNEKRAVMSQSTTLPSLEPTACINPNAPTACTSASETFNAPSSSCGGSVDASRCQAPPAGPACLVAYEVGVSTSGGTPVPSGEDLWVFVRLANGTSTYDTPLWSGQGNAGAKVTSVKAITVSELPTSGFASTTIGVYFSVGTAKFAQLTTYTPSGSASTGAVPVSAWDSYQYTAAYGGCTTAGLPTGTGTVANPTAPLVVSSVALSETGPYEPATWYFSYTLVNGLTGAESKMAPWTQETVNFPWSSVTFDEVSCAGNDPSTGVNLYVNRGGATFYLADTTGACSPAARLATFAAAAANGHTGGGLRWLYVVLALLVGAGLLVALLGRAQ